MARVNQFVQTHCLLTIVIWLLVICVSIPFALHQSNRLVPGGTPPPGSESAKAENDIEHRFASYTSPALAFLLSPQRQASSGGLRATINELADAVRITPGVTLKRPDVESALFASDLAGPILMPLHIVGHHQNNQAIDEVLLKRLAIGRLNSHHVVVRLVGEGAFWASLQKTFSRDLLDAELIGFPLLLTVLLLVFGSFWAAMLPVALGICTVIVTGLLIYVLSHLVLLTIFVSNTASLMAVGVAVDYSLIMLIRLRQELSEGSSIAIAQRTVSLTSGRTIIFSGFAVVMSLAGVWLIPNTTVRSMILGAITAVFAAVTISITLLPALVTVLGVRRIRAPARPKQRYLSRVIKQWGNLPIQHPVISAFVAVVFLLGLCFPALSMRTGTGVLAQLPKDDQTRIGFEKASDIAGPGALEPLYIVSTGKRQLQARVEQLREIVEQQPDVKRLSILHMTRIQNEQYAMFAVTPITNPEGQITKRLVFHLRRRLLMLDVHFGIRSEVGGVAAVQTDQEEGIRSNMWKVAMVVLSLSFVVLTVLLRSILLPLKAIVMNLLSVGSAYGVLVTIFQWGWFGSVLGFRRLGHLETITPPLILAIIFGLSMDYEIFLLSRIREAWEMSRDTSQAVAAGLQASARMIGSAGAILVCVFAVFVGTGATSIQEIGLGGAIAIGIDTTIIRLVLVPALTMLFGRWNWWLPRPLERPSFVNADAPLERVN